LHACYAPEYETVDDTRAKLLERRKEVARRIRLHGMSWQNSTCIIIQVTGEKQFKNAALTHQFCMYEVDFFGSLTGPFK